MSAWNLGDELFVVDKKDGTARKCKVKAIDEDNQRIEVHFLRFNKRFDEWIDLPSDRIVEEEEDKFYDSVLHSDDDEVRAALGELASIDEVTAKIMPLYSSDYKLTVKKMNVIPLQTIEYCAQAFEINLRTVDDKKITKLNLIKLIISKIKSFLPSQCCMCSESFRVKVTEVALFTCAGCKRASHDCEAYKNLKDSFPNLPKGFIWLCDDCGDEAETPEPKPVTEPSEPALTMQPVTQSAVDTGNSATGNSVVDASGATSAPKSAPQSKVINKLNTENLVTLPVCPEYKKSNCPHGIRGNKLIKGNKCKFAHPKPCQKYCGYGSRGEYGCKDGSNCSNFHPRLCRYSLSKKRCTNELCKFVHLKGTARRAAPIVDAPNITLPKKKNAEVVPTQPVKSKPHIMEPQKNKDFLDLVERMEKRFEDLADSMNKRIQEFHQNMQTQQFYPPHQIIPYPPPTMMGYPHPQQLHAIPTQMGRSPVVSHNRVPSSF